MSKWFVSILSSLLILTNTAWANQYKMTYDVYASGFHVVEATMEMDFKKDDHYNTNIFTTTRGFLKKLAPWTGTFYAEGLIQDNNHFQPTLHRAVATWRGEEEVTEYKYTQDGSFVSYKQVEEGVDKTPKEIDSKLTDNTTDIVSSILNTMARIESLEACESESEIFDGKRRYKLKFSPIEKVNLSSSRYNIFEGEAFKCTAEVEPKGGKWHKKPRGWLSIQEQGREKGKLPTIWMGKPKGVDRYVPVKVLVKTEYGTLFLHLTGAEKI